MANTAETEQKLMRPSFYKYTSALEKLDCDAIYKAIVDIADCLNHGGTVFTAGNGGSYSIAQHFAADLRGPLIKDWWHYRDDEVRRVVHLGSNLAEFTALCNDKGYEKALSLLANRGGMKRGDVLFIFSASGKSKNIKLLIDWAFAKGAYCIMASNLGFRDNLAGQDIIIQVKTNEIDNDWYGVVEGVFSCIAHEIANRVKERLHEQG